jgi:CTP synthase (UTP-ammonia lyase)
MVDHGNFTPGQLHESPAEVVTMAVRILLVGEYVPELSPHRMTEQAIGHATARLPQRVTHTWVSTADLTDSQIQESDGVWIAPGSPYRDLVKTLRGIQIAREQEIPCLGTCGGFQHMILEYARNVLGFEDAQHAEYDPYASRLFLTRLACSLVGRALAIDLVPGSKVAAIYGQSQATEQYYCNFGVEPSCVEALRQGPLRISGADAEGEVRVIEHPQHPFYVGTLYLPQAASTAEAPHPLVVEFLRTAASRAEAL